MKAVLFDMDGILIDTEKYLTVYKQKAMREAGYRLAGNGIQIPQLCIRICKRADEGNFWRGFPIR